MKVHIEIDCTPEEARTFLGLPDVQPVQAAVMKELEQRLMSGMQAMDPETPDEDLGSRRHEQSRADAAHVLAAIRGWIG